MRDLGGGDVLPPSDDPLLDPAGDGQPALIVQDPEVAAPKPTSVHGSRRVGLLAVSCEQLGSPDQYLACLPRRPPPPAQRVDDADLGLAHCSPLGVPATVLPGE